MILTIALPPGALFYTDRWYLEVVAGWNNAALLADVCAELSLEVAEWKLRHEGVDVTPTDDPLTAFNDGDTLALVAV